MSRITSYKGQSSIEDFDPDHAQPAERCVVHGSNLISTLSPEYVEGVLEVTCRRWFRNNDVPNRVSSANSAPIATTRLLK